MAIPYFSPSLLAGESRGRHRGEKYGIASLPAACLLLGIAITGRCPARGADILVDRTDASGIRFQLTTGAAAGLKHLYETMIGGAGWLDYDGDGLLDLYLVQGHDDSARAFAAGRQGDVLYRNLGDGTFRDVTESAGVGDRHYGGGLAIGDIDNDGDVDLYVTNYGPNVLYLNDGDGTFTDATATSGAIASLWSMSAAFADINGDGLLDLYVTGYLYYDPGAHKACTGNPKKIPGYCHPHKFDGAPDSLFVNLGGGRFEDVSRTAGVAVSGRILSKGLGVLPTDYDRDGRVDFFIANDSVPNFLWRNLGGNRFEDVALEAGVALNAGGQATACMGIDGGDVNGDGLIDYFVTNFSEETDTLYLSGGDGFYEDATARAGLAEITYLPLGFGTRLFDFDLDGDLDIYIARGHIMDNVEELHPGSRVTYKQSDQLLENDGTGTFRDISLEAGSWFKVKAVGRAAAFADYDNDGDIDIFVVNADRPSVLLENRCPPAGPWVGIECEGNGPSSRSAYGAYVELKVSGRPQPVPLEIRTAASYLAANDHRQVIGVGKGGAPEWALVRWPDGLTERFSSLEGNRYNRLVRGRGEKVSAR